MFCTQNGKNLTFRVDLWSQKVMWLCNAKSDFCKLGVKTYVRLQRKKSWSGAAGSGAAESAVHGLACAAKFVKGGPPRPLHPVHLGLNDVKINEGHNNFLAFYAIEFVLTDFIKSQK